MKKLILSCTLMTICASSYSIALPKDLEQFELTGNCSSCDLSSVSVLQTQHNEKLNLEGANLINSHLHSYNANRQYSNFTACTAIQFAISGGDYSYSHFNNANLKKANLSWINFTGADFTGANVSGVNFTGSNLYKANLSDAQLKSADSLCNTILPNGDISDC